MRIWDYHLNLPFSRLRGDSLTEKADHVIPVADRLGINRFCAVLGSRSNIDDKASEVRNVLTRHRNRLFGFLYLEPAASVENSLDRLNRWVDEGPMVGVALGSASGIASKPAYAPVFERIAELEAIVFQHTWLKVGGSPPHPGGGNVPRESTPLDVVKVAHRHPSLRIICEHTGGDWQLGLRTIRDTENVYAGLSGFYPEAGVTAMAVREVGAERVLYGSDAPGRSLASQLSKVHGANISLAEKELIFSGNLHRLLRPILAEKGIDTSE